MSCSIAQIVTGDLTNNIKMESIILIIGIYLGIMLNLSINYLINTIKK